MIQQNLNKKTKTRWNCCTQQIASSERKEKNTHTHTHTPALNKENWKVNMAGTTYSYQSPIYFERKIRSLTNQISRKKILWTVEIFQDL